MSVYGPHAPSNKNYIFVGHKCACSSTRNPPPAIFKYYIILYIGTYTEISLPILILVQVYLRVIILGRR